MGIDAMRSVAFVLFAVATIRTCTGLECSSCRRKWCERQIEEGLSCAGNLVRDACACCYECAKQLNETCGGYLDANGKCDVGLTCYRTPPGIPGISSGICVRKGTVKFPALFRGVTAICFISMQ